MTWGNNGAEMQARMLPACVSPRRDRAQRKIVMMKSPTNQCALSLLVMLSSFTLAADMPPRVQVTDAWIRWLPANLPSGGYMTLTNTGTVPSVLVSAASPDFGQVSFHRSLTKEGVSDMAAVDTVTVAPHSSVRFSPGGYHIMLMQPKRSLQPSDRVLITLQFADGHSLEVAFEVRASGAGEPGHSDEVGNKPIMRQ
jgi:periplasmic copper chaperone A